MRYSYTMAVGVSWLLRSAPIHLWLCQIIFANVYSCVWSLKFLFHYLCSQVVTWWRSSLILGSSNTKKHCCLFKPPNRCWCRHTWQSKRALSVSTSVSVCQGVCQTDQNLQLPFFVCQRSPLSSLAPASCSRNAGCIAAVSVVGTRLRSEQCWLVGTCGSPVRISSLSL